MVIIVILCVPLVAAKKIYHLSGSFILVSIKYSFKAKISDVDVFGHFIDSKILMSERSYGTDITLLSSLQHNYG